MHQTIGRGRHQISGSSPDGGRRDRARCARRSGAVHERDGDADRVSAPSTGSTSAVSVITGTSCSWTAVSTAGWITVTSGATGSGIGQVNYSVAPNDSGAVRTGTL